MEWHFNILPLLYFLSPTAVFHRCPKCAAPNNSFAMAGSSYSARRQSLLVPPTQPSSRAKPRHCPVRLRDALRAISRVSTPGTEQLPTRSVHYVNVPGTCGSGVGLISVCFFFCCCSAASLHPLLPPAPTLSLSFAALAVSALKALVQRDIGHPNRGKETPSCR